MSTMTFDASCTCFLVSTRARSGAPIATGPNASAENMSSKRTAKISAVMSATAASASSDAREGPCQALKGPASMGQFEVRTRAGLSHRMRTLPPFECHPSPCSALLALPSLSLLLDSAELSRSSSRCGPHLRDAWRDAPPSLGPPPECNALASLPSQYLAAWASRQAS